MYTIDHLGIAVKSLEAAQQFYRNLGLDIVSEETVPAEKVKVAMVPLSESRTELLEAAAETTPIARFVTRRGEGLHHLALHVTDLTAAVEKLGKAAPALSPMKLRSAPAAMPTSSSTPRRRRRTARTGERSAASLS